MSLIQNKDFKYSIQIPTFLSHEKCDELIEQITNTEQKVVGGVGGEKGEAAIIPEIRVTMTANTERILLFISKAP